MSNKNLARWSQFNFIRGSLEAKQFFFNSHTPKLECSTVRCKAASHFFQGNRSWRCDSLGLARGSSSWLSFNWKKKPFLNSTKLLVGVAKPCIFYFFFAGWWYVACCDCWEDVRRWDKMGKDLGRFFWLRKQRLQVTATGNRGVEG